MSQFESIAVLCSRFALPVLKVYSPNICKNTTKTDKMTDSLIAQKQKGKMYSY